MQKVVGAPPLRIDVLTTIDAVEFDEAWTSRLQTSFASEPVGVLSFPQLIRNKRAAGRPQDLADVDWLEKSAKK